MKVWMRGRLAWRTASAGALDVGLGGAREAGDDRALASLGHFADRFEIAWAGDREAGLDDVDAQRLELLGDLQLLLEVHRAAR